MSDDSGGIGTKRAGIRLIPFRKILLEFLVSYEWRMKNQDGVKKWVNFAGYLNRGILLYCPDDSTYFKRLGNNIAVLCEAMMWAKHIFQNMKNWESLKLLEVWNLSTNYDYSNVVCLLFCILILMLLKSNILYELLFIIIK